MEEKKEKEKKDKEIEKNISDQLWYFDNLLIKKDYENKCKIKERKILEKNENLLFNEYKKNNLEYEKDNNLNEEIKELNLLNERLGNIRNNN